MRAATAALLVGANLSVALGYGAILPLLPVLLPRIGVTEGIAAAALHTGGLTSIYLAALFVGSLAWGWAADRLGARTTLFVGLLGYSVGLVSLPAANGIVPAYVLRTTAGLFAGAVLPVVDVLAASEPEPVRRARLFAATGAATLIGLLIGPALSGGVARFMQGMSGSNDMSAMTLLWAMAATAFVALAVAVGAVRMPQVALSARPRASCAPLSTAPWSRHIGVFTGNFLVLFGLGAFEVMMPLLGERVLSFNPGTIALAFAECSAVMLAVQAVLFLTPVLARMPPRAIVAGGFAIMALGTAGLGLARTDSGVFVASALLAASSGWLLPAIGYIATVAERQGLMKLLAVLTAAGILGQAVGSAAGGWLYGWAAADGFWIVAAMLGTGVMIALRREFDVGARPSPKPGEHPQAVCHGP